MSTMVTEEIQLQERSGNKVAPSSRRIWGAERQTLKAQLGTSFLCPYDLK